MMKGRDYLGMLLLAALLVIPSLVFGHQAVGGWQYDASCCSNQDCQAIPRETVEHIPGGYRITLPAGLHITSPQGGVWTVSEVRKRRSGDGDYHICIGKHQQNVICFYAPDMGM